MYIDYLLVFFLGHNLIFINKKKNSNISFSHIGDQITSIELQDSWLIGSINRCNVRHYLLKFALTLQLDLVHEFRRLTIKLMNIFTAKALHKAS